MPDLFTPKQLAEYLQLSPRTVYRMLERNELPGVRVGGQWRFRKSEVDCWLDRGLQRLDTAQLGELSADSEGAAPQTLSELLQPGNVIFDLSPGEPEMAVRELGAERVIYGSDVGGRSFASQLAKVTGAEIPESAKELILGENLRRLLTPILRAKGYSV